MSEYKQDDAWFVELISAAEERAAMYDGDERDCIKTDVMNAFFAGADWQCRRAIVRAVAEVGKRINEVGMSEYKLVPTEPTEEMIGAVGDVIGPCETPEQIYRAMLAAAPDAPAVQAGVAPSERDWNDDASLYQNRCMTCGNHFYGQKRRPTCKVCAVEPVVQAEPVAWALYVRRKDTEWTRYMLYDTEFRATRSMQRIAGDPLIIEIRPLYEHPPAADPVADKMADALRYARGVIDLLSEKVQHAADRRYCARILKEGNSIDAALAEWEQKGGA